MKEERKGRKMSLSCLCVWKWKEFLDKKIASSFCKHSHLNRPVWPRYYQKKIQILSWLQRKTVAIGLIAVHWLNPHNLAIFDLYCALCNFLVTSVGELDHKKIIIWCLQKMLVVLFRFFYRLLKTMQCKMGYPQLS